MMLQTLKLLLPALIPSWRFFSTIAPSPRIEFALLDHPQDTPSHWREFRPRPTHVAPRQMLWRLIWNPVWNESLFLVSCAERLMDHPTAHSIREIQDRLSADMPGCAIDADAARYAQFRLVFVHRDGAQIVKQIEYTSDIWQPSGPASG